MNFLIAWMCGVSVKTFEIIKIKVYPYYSIEDEQFDWLFSVYFNHFDKWYLSTENCGNNFTLNAQSKMFILWKIFECFRITTNTTVELTK